MAYPSFWEIGDFIIARIRRPYITPSPRFSYSSFEKYGYTVARLGDNLSKRGPT